MHSVSSRIWTRIAVSISYGDNQYTTSTTIKSTLINQLRMINFCLDIIGPYLIIFLLILAEINFSL